ncbi:MAG TPA: hypothetical protein VKT73_07205 [Xanthobacteraceae bacterium]|nr:hypothetical protein [Xanthobacteraceae bacterium]
MPIRPFLGNRVFEPELVKAMSQAFEIACDALSLKRGQDDPLTRWIAQTVIAAAEEGHTDIGALVDITLKKVRKEAPED